MEFQPVVMAAGSGSRMTDLTTNISKALLYVGNKPMVWYPVNMLEKAGFEEAIVVVQESVRAFMEKTLVEICDVKIKLDFVEIPDDEYCGTADSLRRIRSKIKTDLLVVSSDLITDVSLNKVANVFRTYDATLTMLVSPLPEQLTEVPAPGVRIKKNKERDFIGLDKKGNRVLFFASEADLDDVIYFKRSFLKKHPYINIKSFLTDCHLYFIKQWVVDFLMEKKSISTVKGELVSYLIKKQFYKKKQEPPQTTASLTSRGDTRKDIFNFIKDDTMSELALQYSTWIDHSGDMADCFHGDKIRCYAYTQDTGFCVRVNTLGTYLEANRQIPKHLPVLLSQEVPHLHPSVIVKGKSQVGNDCLVCEGVTIGERVSIKRSVIGQHCNIGEKVKITNSVIMGHTEIKDGSNIQGCIICPNVHINEKCELKDCIVGSTQNIDAMKKFTNEAFVDNQMMLDI